MGYSNNNILDIFELSGKEVFSPPGNALLAKNFEFKPDESGGPISILAFIKFGKNSALLRKVWNKQ
jgi:hypothetical protein